MKEKVESIKKEFDEDLNNIKSLKDLNEIKVNYFGKKGKVSELSSMMREVEDKKTFGMKVNEVRNKFNNLYENKKIEIEEKEINEKLMSESIDVSLPGTKLRIGSAHPIERIIETLEELLI